MKSKKISSAAIRCYFNAGQVIYVEGDPAKMMEAESKVS